MQQITTQEQVEYASLGWRFAAVLVDTVVLVGLLIIAVMAYVFVLGRRAALRGVTGDVTGADVADVAPVAG